MGLANRITLFRIALAPVFAGLFVLWQTGPSLGGLVVLWTVFLVSELSDILDGWVARRLGQTSDLGKLLDPFSDVVSRLTIFLCLLLAGIAPLWFFLAVLYRELGMTFLRLLMVQGGVVQGASMGGKIKAWLYFLASLVGMVHLTWPDFGSSLVWTWGLNLFFAAAAFQSWWSFAQYLDGYRKHRKAK